MANWNSANHNKYLLQYRLIFVCKYRKQLLTNQNIINDVKRLSVEICSKHKVNIKYMETDKDHIHYMIETTPNIEKTFWTDGYFICSVGNVSEKRLKEYIEN